MIRGSSKLRGVGAALLLLAAVVGVPALLATVGGWPLPAGMPDWQRVSEALTQTSVPDSVLLDGVAIACWVLWAAFTAAVLEEALAVARGTTPRRLVPVGPMQALAAFLVGAIVLSLLTDTSLVTTEQSFTLAVASQSAVSAPVVEVSPRLAPVAQAVATKPTVAYTVVRRDTLWGIAQRHLGDGKRWDEIWALNKGSAQPGGRTFTDANRIHPGWILQLPSDAAGAAVDATPVVLESPAPVAEVPPVEEPIPTPVVVPDAGVIESAVPDAGAEPQAPTASAAGVSNHVASESDGGLVLASGSVVSLTLASGIGAALVAARLRRRRRYDPLGGAAPSYSDVPSNTVLRLRAQDLSHKAEVSELDDIIPAMANPPGVVAMSTDTEDLVDLTAAGGVTMDADKPLGELRSVIFQFICNLSANDAEVVIVGDSLASTVIGHRRSFPGLIVVGDLSLVLDEADAEIVRRTRLLAEGEFETVGAFRDANPVESVPARLIVTSTVAGELHARARAIATEGKNLGIGVLFVASTDADVVADSDLGRVESIHPRSQAGSGERLTLTQGDTSELLDVIQESRTDEPTAQTLNTSTAFASPVLSDTTARTTPRLDLRLFGPCRVLLDGDEPSKAPRRQVRELLAFLALRPLGATAEVVGTAIWPDANGRRVIERMRNLLGSANTDLRSLAGLPDVDFVQRVGDRYRINPEFVSCDLWRFEGAMTDGADAKSLSHAIDLYEGDLCEGSDWPWIELAREDARRRALSSCHRLAGLHSRSDDWNSALVPLRRALQVDPYNEASCCALIQAQRSVGLVDDAKSTYDQFEHRLAVDLGLTPTQSTRRLLEM